MENNNKQREEIRKVKRRAITRKRIRMRKTMRMREKKKQRKQEVTANFSSQITARVLGLIGSRTTEFSSFIKVLPATLL